MAKLAKEAPAEKIEIVDQPEEDTEKGGKRSWLMLTFVLVVALGIFFLVRRFTSSEE